MTNSKKDFVILSEDRRTISGPRRRLPVLQSLWRLLCRESMLSARFELDSWEYYLGGEVGTVKSERILQVALVVLGLLYLGMTYFLYIDLAHSKWLLETKNAIDPMFLSWFIALGPFLLLAARKPSAHRLLIAFAAWQCLAHAAVMTIQTVEAWNHGVHRNFADVVLWSIIGGFVLTLLAATRAPQSFISDPAGSAPKSSAQAG